MAMIATLDALKEKCQLKQVCISWTSDSLLVMSVALTFYCNKNLMTQ